MSETVAKRYAAALFEVAKERDIIDAVESQMQLVADTVGGHDELKRMLRHPQIDRNDKKAVLEKIFKDEVNPEVLNLLKILVDRGRVNLLDDIKEQYTVIANDYKGIVEVTVTTASPLNEAEEKKLAEAFERHFNKKLRIHAKTDPKIIGGVLVKVGNRLYDGTLVGKLNRFAKELKAQR
ncbi:F0F1 ATP synthase subunit delta [Caenibacillus caldisaponilyticus]|jgi:F-type H+-transporting ATPase subunit delta|uniref:F0F1 ATP synthase subunit delta n=1 Tax=Caenibacillus caldisaponilyticus TaxID=1674942 RepID=UPI000988472C|nr:F0F1 ATP synthase subunit delta [Caenibacillus caldisaponilyticus]